MSEFTEIKIQIKFKKGFHVNQILRAVFNIKHEILEYEVVDSVNQIEDE